MTQVQKRTVGVAIVSLVFAIIGMILIGPCGSIFAIPAIICGHVAMSKVKKNPDALTGDGIALAGLIMGYVQIGLMLVITPMLVAIAIPNFIKARDTSQRRVCINNMKMIDSAKTQAALDNNYNVGDSVPENQVSNNLGNGFSKIVCPKDGRYTINPVGQDPACSEHGTLSNAMQKR